LKGTFLAEVVDDSSDCWHEFCICHHND